CLHRGHSAAAIERRTRGLCNDRTLKPMVHLTRALRELESEPPAPSGGASTTGGVNASVGASAPRQRTCARGNDCVDGQVRCTAECPAQCSAMPPPIGGPCPSCSTTGTSDEDPEAIAAMIAAAL